MIQMLSKCNKHENLEIDQVGIISVMVNMLTTLIDISCDNAKICIQSIMVQNYILESLIDIIENCKVRWK